MSRRRVLDTVILINGWRRYAPQSLGTVTEHDVREWAKKIAEPYGSNAIVTPVSIEFRVGVRNPHELRLARAFLSEFKIVDEARVLPEDWEYAGRLADRAQAKPRQLGDCLVRALSNRFGYDVETRDGAFPRTL